MNRIRQNTKPVIVQIRVAMLHHFADLFERLDRLEDPRKRKYYDLVEVLMGGIMLFVLKEGSRNAFNLDREEGNFAQNYERVFGFRLPHADTVNAVFQVLEPEELEAIKRWLIRTLLKKRVLHKFRLFQKYFCIAIDATGHTTFDYEPYKGCPYRVYKDKNGKEIKRVWFQYILEAKLVCPNGFCLSIATEWLENKDEWDKQDCELKGFKRMAVRLKKDYPRLSICILADGLYPNKSVFKICKDNNWAFILTLKDDQLKDVWTEVGLFDQLYSKNTLRIEQAFNAKEKVVSTYRWINDIDYNGHSLSWVELVEIKTNIETGKEEKSRFVQVTGFKVSESNCQEIIQHGRLRWKIENEGFNTQKNGGYELEHKYSRRNPRAIQNYFQCMQIAHIINQLVELSSVFKEMLTAKTTLKHLWKTMIASMYYCNFTDKQLHFQKTQFRYP